MKSRAQREDIQVRQGILNFVKRSSESMGSPFMAKIIQVYSDRMTCDIESIDGIPMNNVPILTKGGLVDGEAYGEIDLPALNDYVIVGFSSHGRGHKVIIGAIFPYLVNEFMKDAVNSGSKQLGSRPSSIQDSFHFLIYLSYAS